MAVYDDSDIGGRIEAHCDDCWPWWAVEYDQAEDQPDDLPVKQWPMTKHGKRLSWTPIWGRPCTRCERKC